MTPDSSATLSQRLADVRRMLEAHGQEHVLRFAESLEPPRAEALLDQVEIIDLAPLAELVRRYVGRAAPVAIPGDLEPAPYYACPTTPSHSTALERSYDVAAARAAGDALIRRGGLAVFTVAGGQGTRLGWNGPKGTYPATPVTGKPLFRCFAEQITFAQRVFEVTIPWYIMTSPENDAATRAFFVDNNCFGLLRKNIMIFPQGMMPAVDAETGRMLLDAPHRIAMSPNGHGGAIAALGVSGALDHMRARGVEHISYIQVDNPLTRAVDPVFVGLHVAADGSSEEMSSKMVVKRAADERVGVLARAGGRTRVIEYSDLPEELAGQRDEDGHLRFGAGSIAVHLIGVAFAVELVAGGDRLLPFHAARKIVPCLDDEGNPLQPEQANAIKFEQFVFDALPAAESSIVVETDRAEEFAPIKNATGADSPATSHQIQIDRAGRWLEAHGVTVPRDVDGHVTARLEISPLTASEPADLVALDLPEKIEVGEEMAL